MRYEYVVRCWRLQYTFVLIIFHPTFLILGKIIRVISYGNGSVASLQEVLRDASKSGVVGLKSWRLEILQYSDRQLQTSNTGELWVSRISFFFVF